MKFPKVSRVLAVLVSLFSLMCSDDEVATRLYPAIDTKAVTEISPNGANLNGEILNSGMSGVIDHGFVYDDATNPTLDKSDRISIGESSQIGDFSAFANRNLVKDKKYYVKAYAVSKNNDFTVYGQQVEFISLGGSVPEIVDFVPKQGAIGDTLIITGSGFSTVPVNNRVRFGLVDSQVVKAHQDSLWCIVPTLAAPGENELTLTVGQLTVKPEPKFTLKAISLISFSPASTSFGDTVIITGINFPLQKQMITATLLLKNATIASVSSTQLKVVIPNDVVIPESTIGIKAGAQTITTTESIKLLKPVIDGFTPQKGTKDTEVTISGNYFCPVKANNKVEINGTVTTVTEASEKTIKIKIPSGIVPGSYPISIIVATQNVISSTQFEIVEPSISTISPLNGTWGNTIAISGENFGAAVADNIVKFDNVQATVVSASATQLTVIVPNNLLTKSSLISVKAITVDNQTATFNSPFELDPPSISSFTPGDGKSTTQVTIVGENFNPEKGNQIVKFGDRQVEILSATPTQLLVKLPTSLIDSDVNIQIDVAEQTALSSNTFHLVSPWKRIQDYPDHARGSTVGFTIDNYGYVALGTQLSGIQSNKACWKYDPTNDQWTRVHDFYLANEGHTAAYINQSAFTIGSNAYVGLGVTGSGGPRKLMRRYSPADDDWSSIADFSGGNREGAVGYTVNGKGYITSGRNQSNQPDFQTWEYDHVQNTWTRKADFLGPPRIEAVGFSIGNEVFLATGNGYVNGIFYNDLWSLNVLLNQWTQKATLPGSVRWKATSFSLNGLGFIIGGSSKNDVYYNLLNDIWMYNPSSNAWTRLEDFPGEARAEAVAFVVGNKAYFGTGLGGSTVYLKDFWEFDPSKL